MVIIVSTFVDCRRNKGRGPKDVNATIYNLKQDDAVAERSAAADRNQVGAKCECTKPAHSFSFHDLFSYVIRR